MRIVQAFVNTRDVEKSTDELSNPEALVDWLRSWGLVLQGSSVTERERRQAISLREGLRELLLSNSGHRGEAARLRALENALGDIPLRCNLNDDGSYDLVALGAGWPGAAARILTIISTAMGTGAWRALKACRRDDCHWAFFDGSKNHSGKWCAMEVCGNLMKARAYRKRLSERASGGSR